MRGATNEQLAAYTNWDIMRLVHTIVLKRSHIESKRLTAQMGTMAALLKR